MLKKLDKLIPVLVNLGKKHVGYGVEPAHYDVVGDVVGRVGRRVHDRSPRGLGGGLRHRQDDDDWQELRLHGRDVRHLDELYICAPLPRSSRPAPVLWLHISRETNLYITTLP